MSKHYKDGTGLPADLIKQLRKSKDANCGLLNMRQIYFGTMDQEIHGGVESIDSAKVSADVLKKVMGIEATPKTNTLATFGHLAGGYDSAYYGYLWSEVYSADMFHTMFGEHKLLDKEAGMAYRTKVLAPGGSVDADMLLLNFLGREPNNEAFLKEKGLV